MRCPVAVKLTDTRERFLFRDPAAARALSVSPPTGKPIRLRAQVKTGRANVGAQRVAATPTSTTGRVLRYLLEHGPSGCADVGTVITNRTGTRGGVSSNGGGDYAAQMLLGRLKKSGLVRHAPSDGSSLWTLTEAGVRRAGNSP